MLAPFLFLEFWDHAEFVYLIFNVSSSSLKQHQQQIIHKACEISFVSPIQLTKMSAACQYKFLFFKCKLNKPLY